MKKLALISMLLIHSSICFTQQKGELNASFLYGQILSNKLEGTPRNYEDYGVYSGVNLKCTANNGFLLNYQRYFAKSRWFFRGDFERRWLTYNTTLYSANYDPEDAFYNRNKKVEVKNQYSLIKLGAGRRFSFFDTKLNWDISIDLAYQRYDENRVGFLDSINVYEVTKIEQGDFHYQVEMDYKDYNNQIKFSFQNSLKYFPTKNFGINFYLTWTQPVKGLYDFNTLTRGDEEVVGNTTYIHLIYGESAELGRVATRFLTFGLGVSYRFGDY